MRCRTPDGKGSTAAIGPVCAERRTPGKLPSVAEPGLPKIAFYYPGPIWRLGDRIKNLLLFFDGVALLVPEYMSDRPMEVDPSMVAGLEQEQLLHILKPEEIQTAEATEAMVSAMADVIASGSLDQLAGPGSPFAELSMSRMGFGADPALADMLYEELAIRGLAKPSADGVSIPLHPLVRNMILVLLAQILRPAGKDRGLDLIPATDRPEVHNSLKAFLSANSPSAGHVVDLDAQAVGVDLASVPIDDILSYRSKNLEAYQCYARNIRAFLRVLAAIPEQDRAEALSDRRAELADEAARLDAIAREWWKNPSRILLGAAGAAWTAVTGDVVGGLLAAGGAAISGSDMRPEALSYLFGAQNIA